MLRSQAKSSLVSALRRSLVGTWPCQSPSFCLWHFQTVMADLSSCNRNCLACKSLIFCYIYRRPLQQATFKQGPDGSLGSGCGKSRGQRVPDKGTIGEKAMKWECSDVLRNREEAEAGMELPQNDQV